MVVVVVVGREVAVVVGVVRVAYTAAIATPSAPAVEGMGMGVVG